MKICYLTDDEINNLKCQLMNKRSKSFSSSLTPSNSQNLSKAFSNLYRQNKILDNSHFFEENIKNILKIEYGWTDAINDTHFFYRIIEIGATKILLKLGYSKKIMINERRFKFTFNQDQSLSIFTGHISRRFITNISEKNKEVRLTLNDEKIIISRVNEIEIDGFFKLTSNNIEKIINSDDVICLYKSINDDKIKDAKYVCCEIKLSMEQINKLIKQFKKDKNILENIIEYGKVIYIGFLGKGIFNNNLLVKLRNIKNIDFIILQIKKCIWQRRNLTQNIDWETYSLCKSLKKENCLLKQKIDILSELVENCIGSKNCEFIGKKRGRK